MDWSRFLRIARCPECRAPVTKGDARVACERGHAVPLTEAGVPLFAPPPRAPSAQETSDRRRHAMGYAGVNAFGYLGIGSGHAEGLYRTVSDIVLRSLGPVAVPHLLEVGCGTGRTLADLAGFIPEAFVVGLDRDEYSLDLAHSILVESGPPVVLDLRSIGFREAHLARNTLPNVFLAQGLADRLPFALPDEGGGFDAVITVNVVDRVPDPEAAVVAMAALLKPGGVFFLADPLDWWQQNGALWERYGRGLEGVIDLVRRQRLEIELAFDGLLYREMNDARGSSTDWPVAVVLARRPG